MPITEYGYGYQMPDRIRNQLTEDFLSSLHKNVTKWYKEKHNMSDNEFTNIGFYVHIEGNGVWSDAFKATCAEYGKQWLYEYSKHLPWYEHDIFSGAVGDLMVELGVIEQGEPVEDAE